MNSQRLIPPKAKKRNRIGTSADIVFCVDATGSMKPCFDGIKNGIESLVRGLQYAASVNFRMRLIGFRDLEDASTPWNIFDFVDSVEEFLSQLNEINAEDDQKYRGAESSLDALYMSAAKSQWRDDVQKCIVFFTDDNSHPRLHPTTYDRPDNGVSRVIQELQTLSNCLFFMHAPKYEVFVEIYQAMVEAVQEITVNWIPLNEKKRVDESFFQSLNWNVMMESIGRSVSVASSLAEKERQR